MSELTISNTALLPVPMARLPITVRPAVLSDVPFMDGLQKMHTKMVGFMPTAQFEGNIKAGRVLIAEEVSSGQLVIGSEEADVFSSLTTTNYQLPTATRTPIGYCIAADRYFKHDDVGIIYQMNVQPGRQRSLVGAMLLKAQFERSAYGCKLYCCWCAQDLAANKFWEAMGFVALAFRTGGTASKKNGPRMHIFWQKRIRSGDTTTPWWFPSETTGGAIRENRLVLPIPPGTHWSDAKPIVLPSGANDECGMMNDERQKGLLTAGVPTAGVPTAGVPGKRARKPKKELVVVNPAAIMSGGLRFSAVLPCVIEEKVEPKEKKVRQKNDPRLVAAARELKDRWLEEMNSGRYLPMANGKYEVSRSIGERGGELNIENGETKLLSAA